MNNYEVSQKILGLSKKIPREWYKKGVKVVDYGAEQKEKINNIIRKGYVEKTGQHMTERIKLSDKAIRMLNKRVESGQFDNKKEVIDKTYEKKIEKAWDQLIRAKRETGELPSAQEARVEYEKFMRSRRS